MNLDNNYYQILDLKKDCSAKDIKKGYYKLSKIHHPDVGGDPNVFSLVNEAYEVLINKKEEYDKLSKFGKDYKESNELYNFTLKNESDIYTKTKDTYDKVKNDLSLNIVIRLNEEEVSNFDGKLEYNRYSKCKPCSGTGKDTKSKLVIEVTDPTSPFYGQKKIFESEEGCDFCEGTGKGWDNNECVFCRGNGKSGGSECVSCEGTGRKLIKQKVSNISLTGEKTVIKGFGNLAKYDNIYGDLIIVKVINNN